MGLFHRKRSSSADRSVRQYPSATAEPKPILKSRYNARKSPASSPETMIHVPEIEVTGENAEPLVQDFQDLYLPKARYPPKVDRSGRSGDARSIKSDKYSVRLEDEVAPPPPEFAARRGYSLHSGNGARHGGHKRRDSGSYVHSNPQSPLRSSGESALSSADTYETKATSISDLPPLQTRGPPDDFGSLEPVMEDDPQSFDLTVPSAEQPTGHYSLEERSEQLFSTEHLQSIFEEPKQLLRFTSFLSQFRPQSIPILIYYLDALKALRAINYANAVAEALEPIPGLGFTNSAAHTTLNAELEGKANQAFLVLVHQELPAYITHAWVQVVSVSIKKRIAGTLPPHLRESSEGLAEVFCLTDPARHDNPIVFASQEFHRTTQYGMGYVIGRNCRFLQGPKTSKYSVARLKAACAEAREQCEVFLNYRRDGSPFMNLLMIAPLFDSRGKTRYFIGAQVDVSGLVKDCTDMEALQRMLEKDANPDQKEPDGKKDQFQELAEMFNIGELDTVKKYGGRLHKEHVEESDDVQSTVYHRPRLLLKDPSPTENARGFDFSRANGRLSGIFQHYLLVRPYPSLRILFCSPSLRVPGILQSPFLAKIGGSPRVRDELAAALARGDNVTAKIRWIFRSEDEGRSRWIHCTPLMGYNGAVGVWMIILVDDDGAATRRFKQAPPVSDSIGNVIPGRVTQSARPDSRQSDRLMSDQESVDYFRLGDNHDRRETTLNVRSGGERNVEDGRTMTLDRRTMTGLSTASRDGRRTMTGLSVASRDGLNATGMSVVTKGKSHAPAATLARSEFSFNIT